MRKSLLSDEEIITLYEADIAISEIERQSNISRQAIYGCLKRNMVDINRRMILTLTCRGCGVIFSRIQGRVKDIENSYCSCQCFASARVIKTDCEPLTDNEIKKYRWLAKKTIKSTGRIIRREVVIHHKDGDLRNYSLDNLQVFRNQASHMAFHHKLRK